MLGQGLGLLARLTWKVGDAALRREYLRRIWRLVRARPDPGMLWLAVVKCACHYHAHTMACQMSGGESPVVNTYGIPAGLIPENIKPPRMTSGETESRFLQGMPG